MTHSARLKNSNFMGNVFGKFTFCYGRPGKKELMANLLSQMLLPRELAEYQGPPRRPVSILMAYRCFDSYEVNERDVTECSM
jgi:hypothetical protein